MATSAESARLGTDRLIMKVSSSRKDSLMPICPNGPACLIVAQMVKPVRIRLTVAVSRGPRRNAAQTSGRIARKPSGLEYSARGSSGLKAMRPTPRVTASTAIIDITSPRSKSAHSERAHSTITGVTTSAPAASPSHQVTQIGKNFVQAAKPARQSVVTPTLALMMVAGPTLTRANFATCAGVAKVSRAARPAPDQEAADHRLQRIAERR